MVAIEEILNYNKQFVKNREYLKYQTSKYPKKKMVILTCMDTRLLELLPKAMDLKNGDAKIIKNAGALVCEPFGSVMRSIIIALYELEAKEVCVVGHYDCGMANLQAEKIMEKMAAKGIREDTLRVLKAAGIDIKEWLSGFDTVEDSVKSTVEKIKNHPLLPRGIPVHGLIMEPETGELKVVINGYAGL